MGMIFDYAVKYRGKYYAAGEPIEEAAPDAQEAAQEPATDETEATPEEKPDAPKKAARSRKKGDA